MPLRRTAQTAPASEKKCGKQKGHTEKRLQKVKAWVKDGERYQEMAESSCKFQFDTFLLSLLYDLLGFLAFLVTVLFTGWRCPAARGYRSEPGFAMLLNRDSWKDSFQAMSELYVNYHHTKSNQKCI